MYFVLVVLADQYVDGGFSLNYFNVNTLRGTQDEGSDRVEKNSFCIKQVETGVLLRRKLLTLGRRKSML